MKILIINPNSSVDMTNTIDGAAKKYAQPGTEITTVMTPDGPEFLADAYDCAIQVPKVLDIVEKNKDNYDYFIIACGYDPGLDACRTITKNVIGIGEAAIMTACAVAKRFSFLNSTPGSTAAVPERLRAIGVDPSKCASARPIGTDHGLVDNRHEHFEEYVKLGKKLIEDGAGAIIPTCAGMSDLKEALEQRLGVPVIPGVVAAVKMAEQFWAVASARAEREVSLSGRK